MNPLRIIAGNAHPELGARVAQAAGAELVPCTQSAFADGEPRVRIEGDVEGAEVCIVQPTAPPVNDHLLALALLADAARTAGAARLTAVLPYFGYARQDVLKRPGEARSAQVAARVLEGAGFDRLVLLELHSPALESAFRIPVAHLAADDAVLPALLAWRLRELVVVSPDAGGLKRAQRYASLLHAPVAVVAKTRPGADVSSALAVLGDVEGRECLIVDDMASTGGTIAGAAQALKDAGAAAVHAFFVHAILAPGALERMKVAGVQRIAATDTVVPLYARPNLLSTVPVAPLLARALA
jgi:ribose-phosphate pyrophosphokinase